MVKAIQHILSSNKLQVAGSQARVAIGGWFLLALVLIAYNGINLMKLIDAPMVGRSQEVKLASQKWRQFKQQVAINQTIAKQDIDYDALFRATAAKSAKQPLQLQSSASTVKVKSAPQKVILPLISGIVQNSDLQGHIRSVVVINGKRFYENDRWGDLRIVKIKADGIMLARGGRRWFVAAPRVQSSRYHN